MSGRERCAAPFPSFKRPCQARTPPLTFLFQQDSSRPRGGGPQAQRKWLGEEGGACGGAFATFIADKTASGQPAGYSFVLRGYSALAQRRIRRLRTASGLPTFSKSPDSAKSPRSNAKVAEFVASARQFLMPDCNPHPALPRLPGQDRVGGWCCA